MMHNDPNRFYIEIENFVKSRIERAMQKAILLIFTTAFKNCPVDTGNLRMAIKFHVDMNKGEGEVYVDKKQAPYAIHIEYGVQPHLIYPGKKGFLSWKPKKGNKYIYTKKPVQHPGIRATYFMRNALWSNEQEILNIFRKELGMKS